MREQIRSLNQANQNTQNDMAMMRTAEGAVANIVETLKTLKQKAIDSANDSNTDEDRRIMQKEVDQLLDQIDDNAIVTFNGKFLVNGNMSGISRMIGAVWICKGLYCPEPIDTLYNLQNRTLTQLRDRDGKPLQIEEGDTFTISHVVNGNTYTRTEAVGNYTLRDILSNSPYAYPGNGSYDVPYASYHNQQTPVNSNPGQPAGIIPIIGLTADQYIAGIEAPSGMNVVKAKDGGILIVPNPSESAVAVTSVEKAYQLSGLNIIIRDGGGNVKQDATRALKFKCLQRGEGPSGESSNGSVTNGAAVFHVGAGANQSMAMSLSDMRASALGLKSKNGDTVSIKTRDDALGTLSALDNAIDGALDQLTSIGVIEARLEYTAANITTSTENVQNADSTNRDADMAKEMTNYTKDNILLQAAQAMLAQANQDASSVLGLLS